MHQCEECGHCIKGVKLVDEHQTDESMRVFCPAHDMHDARYTDGRPLLDDKCPLCELEHVRQQLRAWEKNSTVTIGMAEAIIKEHYEKKAAETCKWERQDFDSDCYETSCDQAFCLTDGTPKENDFKFCAYCGRKIESD